MDKATQRDIVTILKALIAVFGIKKGTGLKSSKSGKKRRKMKKNSFGLRKV